MNFPFQFFAWVGSILYATEVLGTKLLSRHQVRNAWLMNFAYCSLMLVFVVPVSLYFGAGWPVLWGNLFWAGAFWALGNILYIVALYKMDLTTLSPLFIVRMGFTLFLGMVFLGEHLSIAQLLFIGLMFCGSLLVTLDERMSLRTLTKSGVLFIVAMWLVFSLDAMFIKKTIIDNGFWTATLWMFLIAEAFFLFTIPKFSKEIKHLRRQAWLFILFIAILDFVATLAVNRAYEKNISISSAIVTLPLSAIMAFILSFIKPGLLEKHSMKVYAARFIGIAIIVWAGIKLS
jgi:drug/metabolite transporter (DMT)-like permease